MTTCSRVQGAPGAKAVSLTPVVMPLSTAALVVGSVIPATAAFPMPRGSMVKVMVLVPLMNWLEPGLTVTVPVPASVLLP